NGEEVMKSSAWDTIQDTLCRKETILIIAILSVLVVIGATNIPVNSKMYINGPLGRAKLRANVVASSDTLNLGIVWPDIGEEEYFVKGVELATEEVNATGGVLGKKIVPKVEFEDLSQTSRRDFSREGRRVAEKFAYDPSIFAVIGHESSSTALAAAVVYSE